LSAATPVFVFGEESVEKQKEVESLRAARPSKADQVKAASAAFEDAKKKLSMFERDRAREIKNLLTAPGGDYNFYDAGKFKVELAALRPGDDLILEEEKRNSLLTLRNAEPKEPIALPAMAFPDLASVYLEVESAVNKTVVSSILADLAADSTVADWANTGLRLHTRGGDATVCKFCEQPLPLTRLRQLEAHFNDRYAQFVVDLDAKAARIESMHTTMAMVVMPDGNLLYPDLRADYESAIDSLRLNLRQVQAGLAGLASALRKKKDQVFVSLDLNDMLCGGNGSAQADTSRLLAIGKAVLAGAPAFFEFGGKAAFERVRDILELHNKRSMNFQTEVWEARELLLRHELGAALPEWRGLMDGAGTAEVAVNNAAAEVQTLDARIDALEASIRQHAPTAQQLNRDLVAYLGHEDIQVRPANSGYQVVRCGIPATDLSEGERTAIAFLHFLNSLQDQSFDLKSGIVVVDDPISSLDSNSVYSAFGFLKSKLKEANQLFVLTHSYTFFREVRKWFDYIKPKNESRFLMLRCAIVDGVRKSEIRDLDSMLKNHESEYHYLFKRVADASSMECNEHLEAYYELPNLARRLLETFLTFKVPDNTENSISSRLRKIHFDEARKARIERFVNVHSHSNQLSDVQDDPGALAEAPQVLRDLLKLIEDTDKHHFDGMIRATSANGVLTKAE
jgi:wobble nucleotide-excising tRNase